MYGTITRVAAGWPTTFCDRTAVRSSLTSVPCFLDRFCELFGLSTAPSALIISAAFRLTRGRRRCSGGFGSFILGLPCLLPTIYQDTRTAAKTFRGAVTGPLVLLT